MGVEGVHADRGHHFVNILDVLFVVVGVGLLVSVEVGEGDGSRGELLEGDGGGTEGDIGLGVHFVDDVLLYVGFLVFLRESVDGRNEGVHFRDYSFVGEGVGV